jgi:SOS-response transcriptional repressor LexA
MTESANLHILGRRTGEFSILQLAWPGHSARNIGVLLLDPAADRLFLRLADLSAEEPDPEYCARLEEGIRDAAREMGAAAFRRWCEDTLSGVLRISDRHAVEVDAFTRVLERLYAEHVEPVAVEPFQTHLPLYTLRAAAGKFGEERAVEIDPEDWIPAPGGRLDEGMFVARVVGRSMEPRIPDGSLNVFRAPVVGSRQNRIVLAERRGLPEDSRFTVKRYTSRKRATGDDQWEHESVRLEPLNPEFEAFELQPGDQIIAEWIRTLE